MSREIRPPRVLPISDQTKKSALASLFKKKSPTVQKSAKRRRVSVTDVDSREHEVVGSVDVIDSDEEYSQDSWDGEGVHPDLDGWLVPDHEYDSEDCYSGSDDEEEDEHVAKKPRLDLIVDSKRERRQFVQYQHPDYEEVMLADDDSAEEDCDDTDESTGEITDESEEEDDDFLSDESSDEK